MKSLWITSAIEKVGEVINGTPIEWSGAWAKFADIWNAVSIWIALIFLGFFCWKIYTKLVVEPNKSWWDISFKTGDIIILSWQFIMFLFFITPMLWSVIAYFVEWGIN